MPRYGKRGGPRRGGRAVQQYPTTPVVGYVTITSPAPPNLAPSDTFQITILVESPALPEEFGGPARLALGGRTEEWASDDVGVATVSGTGLVAYVGPGTCTISVKVEGVTALQSITCETPAATVDQVLVTPSSATIAVGSTTVLAASPVDSGLNFLPGRVVAWESSNPAVATVGADSGDDNHTATVTGQGAGSCTITATCETIEGTSSITASVINTYRGANLPFGITPPATLGDPFGGAVWDITDLIVGSSRYNAATVLTVSSTGSAGRTELVNHLATVAANDLDYIIKLPVGTVSGAAVTLPAKSYPARHCWVVNTDVHAGTFATARGAKIPASTTGMSIIEGPAANGNSVVVFADSGNARGYSFHGCVIQNNQTSAAYDIQLGIIEIRRQSAQTTIDGYPGRLYLDRCWLRGSTTTDTRRGIMANGPYLWVEDSRITEIHYVGNEAAGIGGWTGSQFHAVINCTIEAGSQTMLYGGADPHNPQTNLLDPADIFVDKVYGFKPLTWLTSHGTYAGIHWTVKTGFEAKNCRRWVIDRSITQNNWPDAQSGWSMLFQNLSDNNTNHLENRIEDIVVRHHKFDYVAMGPDLAARVVYGGGTLPQYPANRIVFDNILLTRVGGDHEGDEVTIQNGQGGGRGIVWGLFSDLQNLVIDRITSDGRVLATTEGTAGSDWSLTNMVGRMGTYGVFRSGGQEGMTALNSQCPTNLTVDGNVGYDYVGSNGSLYTPEWDINETNASMLFADYANYDYNLTSAHLTSGVSGGVPGCDITELETQISGVAD